MSGGLDLVGGEKGLWFHKFPGLVNLGEAGKLGPCRSRSKEWRTQIDVNVRELSNESVGVEGESTQDLG